MILAAGAISLLLPTSSAQAAPEILLPEAPPGPGEAFVATFRVPGGVLDVGVQDHVSCLLTGAEDDPSACDWRGDVVTLRVLPTAVEYALPLTAPAQEGNYTLRITRAPFADSTFQSVSAEATLEVRAPVLEEPLDPGTDTDPAPGPTGGGNTNIWNIFVGRDTPAASGDPDAADDAERWMVSSTVGSAALLALVVAGRKGGSS